MAALLEGSERAHRKPNVTEVELIKFESYEEYLDSIYNSLDACYLEDKWMCRKIAELGYRRDGVTFTEPQFWKKRAQIMSYLTPKELIVKASEGFRFGDPSQNALAIRERSNRIGMLCTIIFINYTTPTGRDISGYIDFAHSLLKKDWKKFFRDNTVFYPDEHDLGYFDWKKQKTVINDSLYYKTLMSPKHGLVFQHKYDRMMITPDPFAPSTGHLTTRTTIKSLFYNCFILYDHILRTRK